MLDFSALSPSIDAIKKASGSRIRATSFLEVIRECLKSPRLRQKKGDIVPCLVFTLTAPLISQNPTFHSLILQDEGNVRLDDTPF